MFAPTRPKLRRSCLALLLGLLAAAPAYAGGFYLAVQEPSAKVIARVPEAVLVARPAGCYAVNGVIMSAIAVGKVNGQQRRVPVRVTPMADGLYAVTRQWPKEGVWVLAVTCTSREDLPAIRQPAVCSRIVGFGPDGKFVPDPTAPALVGIPNDLKAPVRGKLKAGEIEQALQDLIRRTSKGTQTATAR